MTHHEGINSRTQLEVRIIRDPKIMRDEITYAIYQQEEKGEQHA